MHRTQTSTLAFAVAAALVTALAALLAYRGLSAAFEDEFRSRVERVAGIAASQVAPSAVAELRRFGAESGGFFEVQAQLDMLCSVTGFEDFQLVDTTRAVLYDVRRAEEGIGARSAWDSLAPGALAAALAGEATSAPPLRRGDLDVRASFQPVLDGGRVVAVLVAEARPEWAPELRRLGRRLALVTAVSVAAIAVLAGILVRGIGRQLSLERQLTRSDNLAAMGRLTATLAHEIKNPLAIIRGTAKRLGRLEPEAQGMADSVIEEVDRLGRTVGRYLQFARIEQDPGGSGDLAVALGATLDLLEGEVRARNCVLEREGDFASPAVIRLDLESLKQVCLNLVLNALEASPEGGHVHVALERRAARVTLSVRDDGPGMPDDVLRRLGEPFFTTKAKGTGLGLFLSKRLVEGAGGRLAVSSAPGEGTHVSATFRLTASADEARGTGSAV
jgi:signal transduction histidine kinase